MDTICEKPIAYVVGGDPRIRESIARLVEPEGIGIIVFDSIAQYRAFERTSTPACLILDLWLPDGTGLELQTQLAGSDHPPIVFVTGYGDIASSVRALKAGAVDFLVNPFDGLELLFAVRTAFECDRSARAVRAERTRLLEQFSRLTPREREILPLVASGSLNRQVAAMLGISEVTIQIHRGNVMRKMGAKSLPQLVRIVDQLYLHDLLTGRETHTNVRPAMKGADQGSAK